MEGLKNEGDILANCINTITNLDESVPDSSNENLRNEIIKNNSYDLRITIIDPDGNVIYDSISKGELSENHLQRKEISEAFTTGSGQSVRYSTTWKDNTYYYAKLLNDGTVLRVAKLTNGMFAIFIKVIPIILFIVIFISIICLYFSSLLTKKLIKPIYDLIENEDNYKKDPIYDELVPFIRKINSQTNEIKAQIEKIQNERDTIKLVTDNMREGLILINKEKNILSLNKSAVTLFGGREHQNNYMNKHILALSRNLKLSECLDKTFEGENTNLIAQTEAGSYNHIFNSPVYIENKLTGAIILVLDVTDVQKAEDMRKTFTANVSHELKTPLTSISGFAEMIKDGMVTDYEDIKDFATRIYKESGRLITLIEDIIHLSQIEETKIKHKEQVDISDVCIEVINALQFVADQKNVKLSFKGEKIILEANKQMLYELIYNLCDNAVKYNKPKGKVDINVSRIMGVNKNDAFALLTVSDNGIGIPKEHHKRVFERFYRVDKSRSKQTGGTGLGLSIVKHVAEYHSATVDMQSEEEKGTTITVKFPIIKVH